MENQGEAGVEEEKENQAGDHLQQLADKHLQEAKYDQVIAKKKGLPRLELPEAAPQQASTLATGEPIKKEEEAVEGEEALPARPRLNSDGDELDDVLTF